MRQSKMQILNQQYVCIWQIFQVLLVGDRENKMYKLKIPVEKITFQQWLEIFETLRAYGDFGYKILKNDEQPY